MKKSRAEGSFLKKLFVKTQKDSVRVIIPIFDDYNKYSSLVKLDFNSLVRQEHECNQVE